MKQIAQRLRQQKLPTTVNCFRLWYSPCWKDVRRGGATTESQAMIQNYIKRLDEPDDVLVLSVSSSKADLGALSTVRSIARKNVRKAYFEVLRKKGYDATGRKITESGPKNVLRGAVVFAALRPAFISLNETIKQMEDAIRVIELRNAEENWRNSPTAPKGIREPNARRPTRAQSSRLR